MSEDNQDSDWRLKLRYGKLTTPFTHFTLIAEGRIVRPLPVNGNACSQAFMRMKIWCEDEEAAQDILMSVAQDVGFETSGQIYFYKTDPDVPPRSTPIVYDIGFTPYTDD